MSATGNCQHLSVRPKWVGSGPSAQGGFEAVRFRAQSRLGDVQLVLIPYRER